MPNAAPAARKRVRLVDNLYRLRVFVFEAGARSQAVVFRGFSRKTEWQRSKYRSWKRPP